MTDLPTPAGPGLPPGHVNEYADRAIDHREWQRLDPLMLLVQPIKEIIRFLPALIGIVIAGNRSGGGQWWWNVIGIGIPIALGIARYLTTSFRIADGRVELRRGLLNKHLLSTPIDRVRTVDISASPIHRVVGLTTVRIGTGTASTRGDDELDLDGIRASAAGALRRDLLHGVELAGRLPGAAGRDRSGGRGRRPSHGGDVRPGVAALRAVHELGRDHRGRPARRRQPGARQPRPLGPVCAWTSPPRRWPGSPFCCSCPCSRSA